MFPGKKWEHFEMFLSKQNNRTQHFFFWCQTWKFGSNVPLCPEAKGGINKMSVKGEGVYSTIKYVYVRWEFASISNFCRSRHTWRLENRPRKAHSLWHKSLTKSRENNLYLEYKKRFLIEEPVQHVFYRLLSIPSIGKCVIEMQTWHVPIFLATLTRILKYFSQ